MSNTKYNTQNSHPTSHIPHPTSHSPKLKSILPPETDTSETQNSELRTAPLKVAHIAAVDLSLRHLLLNQLLSIKAAGFEVSGISSPGSDVAALKAAGIRHISVPITRSVTPLADLQSLWRLYRVMRRERFTIVHAHTPKAELLGQLAARLAGVPIVIDTFRGLYFRQDMHPLWRRLFVAMARLAASCADLVLSQSQEAMQMALREGICPSDKIKLLGNGIDIHHFERGRLSQAALNQKRMALGISPGTSVIGFVGRLVREKGILELLQAAQIIQRSMPNMRLLIIGPVDTEKPDALTPEIAKAYGLAESCIFTGKRDDMPELYALMDVFVLPTHRESFPRSPMEASAMEVPCIVTDIPGCRETVEHNRNGLLVPVNNVQALAESIFTLLTQPDQAHRMGQAGRQMAMTRFDEQVVFAKVKAEYTRLLQTKGILNPTLHPEAVAPHNFS